MATAVPRFYVKTKQNAALSAEAGRPIFEEIEMVAMSAGDRNFEPHFPAHEPTVTYNRVTNDDDTRTWAERYPNEYRAFKEQHLTAEAGTPLEEWPVISRAKASELKALGISTVEQVAAMSERSRAMLGDGARQLIAQAEAYIQQAREMAPVNALATQNAELLAEIERMKAEMAEKPKRGRPRKTEDAAEDEDDAA